MIITYVISFFGGIAVGLTIAADQTLSAMKSKPKKHPAMTVGAPLTRRYIEVMGVSVVVWCSAAAYLFFNPSAPYYLVAWFVPAVITFKVCKRVEPAIQKRYE